MVKKDKLFMLWGIVFLMMFGLALVGCKSKSNDSAPCPGATSLSGVVSQGAVSGATVFADHTLGAEANHIMDTNEAAYTATTSATGGFDLPLPPYAPNYMVVSQGGIDTITGKPAMQMLANPGDRNISPLTTMVVQNPAMKAIIEGLGIKYDADISASLTPAAAFFVQSVQTIIAAATDVLDTGGNSLRNSEIGNIQQTLMTAIANQIVSQGSGVSLSDPASLTTSLTTALTAGLTTVAANSGGDITIPDASALADAMVAPTVQKVFDVVSAAVGSSTLSTNVADVFTEETLISAGAGEINTTTSTIVTASSGSVTVVPTPNTAPSIQGTPATAVNVGQAYSFTPSYSDPDAGDTHVFSIVNKPTWATFNLVTGELKGTPSSANAGVTRDIVISVQDGMNVKASLPKFNITVLTGSSGQ